MLAISTDDGFMICSARSWKRSSSQESWRSPRQSKSCKMHYFTMPIGFIIWGLILSSYNAEVVCVSTTKAFDDWPWQVGRMIRRWEQIISHLPTCSHPPLDLSSGQSHIQLKEVYRASYCSMRKTGESRLKKKSHPAIVLVMSATVTHSNHIAHVYPNGLYSRQICMPTLSPSLSLADCRV